MPAETKIWFCGHLGNYPLASLTLYRGNIRRSILDVKVRGLWQSAQTLTEVFSTSTQVLDWISDADLLMPVPSSVWSRWHGKFDLAYLLAEGLHRRSKIKLCLPPRRLYFRLKKQSFRTRSDRQGGDSSSRQDLISRLLFQLLRLPRHDTNSRVFHGLRMIIIDDIVTSGRTLQDFAQNWPDADIRFLTLATAYSGNSKGKPDD